MSRLQFVLLSTKPNSSGHGRAEKELRFDWTRPVKNNGMLRDRSPTVME